MTSAPTSADADIFDKPHGVPPLRAPDADLLRRALKRGWQDFTIAPGPGLFFSVIYVLFGWCVAWITFATGHSYWLVLAAIGFPLVGPFAAVGLYEVSHRIEQGQPIRWSEILGVIWQQRGRQLPWLCAIIVILFLFWFFVGHMIFALFLGLSAMTNVSSSVEVYLTPEGVSMLATGTLVGAIFALVLFSFSLLSLPMLLDREVDFVSAMLASMALVRDNPVILMAWALFIAVVVFVAMIPGFLGLLFVFPWLAHASWHVYALMRDETAKA